MKQEHRCDWVAAAAFPERFLRFGAEQKLRAATLIPMVTLILISEVADATKAPSDTEIAKNHARRTGIVPDGWLSGRYNATSRTTSMCGIKTYNTSRKNEGQRVGRPP
ncbi:hypothetical protein PISMIDRAFT_657696 [Pisolithus microcarpus 441]|uniref:Uncharacterized protein n=1 Tax=Pisolithus microcarpus 441 TaxID=765257 RepID=A0A0C9ZCN3_9AGAM|nr:hypothetical protein PISMIDRAFT_657696 [Pisolithus microcarpus 441]